MLHKFGGDTRQARKQAPVAWLGIQLLSSPAVVPNTLTTSATSLVSSTQARKQAPVAWLGIQLLSSPAVVPNTLTTSATSLVSSI